MSKLTPKQDAFVKAYLLNGGNATQAAIDAGYKADNAKQIGSENLSKLDIKKAIEAHQKEANKSFIYSKERKLEILQSVMENAAEVSDEEGFNKGKMNNHSAVIAAIKEHNLMQGDNAPTQTENTHTIKTFGDMYGDS